MNRSLSTLILTGALAFSSAVTPAIAQNPNYAPGDLVMFFQKEDGNNTLYANLGNAATLYRGTAAGPGMANRINFLDISAALTSAFGAGWAADPTLYAGLAGVWGTSATSLLLQDGDPHRTVYISNARTAVGSVGQGNSSPWSLFSAGNGATIAAAQNIFTQNFRLETLYTTAVAISPKTDSFIDDKNPFLVQGQQGNGFGAFEGGVQQMGNAESFGTFGPAGSVEFALDLYRILARTGIAGQVTGDLRVGSFEGTVTLNSAGQVSFISQGTTTPFQTWALTFPALDTAAKRLPDADPDNDGLSNLMEFVLNGDPGISDPAVAPALVTSGTDFVFSSNRRDDSEPVSTLTFQYSTDLTSWTDVTVGASSGVVGAATLAVTENATAPDAISITIPKTVAAGGKLFGRLKASQP